MGAFILDRDGKVNEIKHPETHQHFFLRKIFPTLPEKLNLRVINDYLKKYSSNKEWRDEWEKFVKDEAEFKHEKKFLPSGKVVNEAQETIFYRFWYSTSYDMFYSYMSLLGFICGVLDGEALMLRINGFDDIRDQHIEPLIKLAHKCDFVQVDLYGNRDRVQSTKILRPQEFYDKL